MSRAVARFTRKPNGVSRGDGVMRNAVGPLTRLRERGILPLTRLRERGIVPLTRLRFLVAFVCFQAAAADVTVERRADRIDVAVDGKPFTSYIHAGHRKPILFPVHGPGGVDCRKMSAIVLSGRLRRMSWIAGS